MTESFDDRGTVTVLDHGPGVPTNTGELRHHRPEGGRGAAFTLDLPAATVPVLPAAEVEPAVLPQR